jgi:hypothetical protein
MHTRFRFGLVVGLTIAGLAPISGTTAHAVGPTIPVSAPSAFRAVQPCRLLDTRTNTPGRLTPNVSADVQVTGRCEVPMGATAAALTVTAVYPSQVGFVTVWPTGAAMPLASALNYRSGEVRANSALVQIGAGGAISVVSSAATDLVVDVSGYFVAAAGPVAAGRFVQVTPHRLVDTRQTGRPGQNGVVHVEPDVPPGAIAVAINVTTTEALGPDVLVAYPSGAEPPLASMLNVDAAQQTRAASTIVGLDDGGFEVSTRFGNHVIVDITGYFTGPSWARSTDGLFVATVPVRLVDTRVAVGPSGGPRLHDSGGRQFVTTGVTGVPVAAIAANWTVTETEDTGWWLGYPAGTAFGTTSTLNADGANQTIANSAITAVTSRGVAVHALQGTQLIVDITGWFTGPPMPTTTEVVPSNDPPVRFVTIISDSAVAGIRWTGALGGLQGFPFDDRLESCRRLVQPSCRGREGYAPRTVVNEINVLPVPGPNDLLVIATGYDDWHTGFSTDFERVVAAARAKGFRHIAWMTYRSNVGYSLPGTAGRSNYGEMNRVLAEKVASGANSDVRIWDFDTFARVAPGWFTSDGVHETRLGAWGVADWISRHVAAYDGKPCVQPWTVGDAPESPCPNPDSLSASRGMPNIASVYGV